MRQTLVLVWNSALRKSSISIFEQFFDCIDKISIVEEDWALGYNSVKIWDLFNISQFPMILNRSVTREVTSICHVYY